MKLRGVRREFAIDDVVGRGWFKGATHADVERVLRRALKEMVLQGSDLRLRIEHLEATRRRENARRNRARKHGALPLPSYGDFHTSHGINA